MLKVARTLIEADRTGSWNMHLEAVHDCIPIFAAAVKSAYLYCQQMNDLKHKYSDFITNFESGLHVIRRTNNFCAGVGLDLEIEQTLMRSLKSCGGLTRGSGMTEEIRTIWTMSSCVTSVYNNAMQEFAEKLFTSSEQHKESTNSRIQRNEIDKEKLLRELHLYNPFSGDCNLRNVVIGVVASENMNVHKYEQKGQEIINKMIG